MRAGRERGKGRKWREWRGRGIAWKYFPQTGGLQLLITDGIINVGETSPHYVELSRRPVPDQVWHSADEDSDTGRMRMEG